MGDIVSPNIGNRTISFNSGQGGVSSYKGDTSSYRSFEFSPAKIESISLGSLKSKDKIGNYVAFGTNANITNKEIVSGPALMTSLFGEKGIVGKIKEVMIKTHLKVETLSKPATVKAEPVYSSWFGIQNDEMWALLQKYVGKGLESLPNKLLKKTTKKFNDEHDDYGGIGTGSGKLGNFFDNVNSFNDFLQDDLAMNHPGYDKDYQLGKKQKFKNVNITLAKASWSGALLDTGEGVLETAAGTFSGRARVGYLDAAASVSAGPGHISAEASATFGLAKVEGKYSSPRLMTESGLELLSADVNGSVSVCEGTAKARACVGGYYEKDENGKTVHHFEAGVSLNAEANLVKATATGQVNVFGVGVQGEATFKVGVGAKLDAGYIDGKLHFKIGLAAGIGFEFGFSLDLGGFVSNVGVLLSDFKEDILNTVDDVIEFGHTVWEGAKEVASDVWDGIQTAGGYILDGLETVGDGIADVVEDVGSWGIWFWNW